MNRNKIIAIAIFLFIFLVPFRALYFTDHIVDSAKDVFLLVTCLIGFFVAFGIGTNEPFGRKEEEFESEEEIHESQKQAA